MALSAKSTGVSHDWLGPAGEAVFRGPEYDFPIDHRELVKIQIDIRRNIPKDRQERYPVVDRKLGDPLDLVIPRRYQEGKIPIFDREDINKHLPKQEKEKVVEEPTVRIIPKPLEEYERKLGSEITAGEVELDEEDVKHRPRSPRRGRDRDRDEAQLEEELPGERVDIRARLGGRERSPARLPARERLGERLGGGGGVRARLGDQEQDVDYHHHRPHYRGRGRGRGGYRGYRGGRTYEYSGRDKYHPHYQQEEPSSTTD